MYEISAEISFYAGNFAVVNHVEDQLQMQHNMQTASASILTLKNRLSDIQNFAFLM